MSAKQYVVAAELATGELLITKGDAKPLAQALDTARILNQTTFSPIPAGGLTEWFCREGWKRYRR
ncbi:hypothetical protein [Methylocaldum sp.]|uniref:hypothetical protein n=1 Tax=Methylocaldum sp. TaxID=1969727 RepID=UPI002D5965C6|nr:hypothetical protein [Methylocaldum sp.]HYE35474.1 hypothetical protein [Methylocaldum sp.]